MGRWGKNKVLRLTATVYENSNPSGRHKSVPEGRLYLFCLSKSKIMLLGISFHKTHETIPLVLGFDQNKGF